MSHLKSSTPSGIALTGVKPTGKPHLGNYFSAIHPAIALSKQYESYFFIANYHALNAIKDAKRIRNETLEVAATWLACGLDPKVTTFYQQSDIPELFEITIILMAYTAKGFMNRAHAYKAMVQDNEANRRDTDEGVNMGLFNYPIMMAADILAFKTHFVPIGKDQLQHLEMTQDIAQAFNRGVGSDCLVYPKPVVNEQVKTIVGTDGRKMSKSYNNTIPIFAEERIIRKAVMKIVTTSQDIAEPKDPETCNVFALYQLFADDKERDEMERRYRAGGLSWGEAKTALFELIVRSFKPKRERYLALMKDEAYLEKILRTGGEKARVKARETLAEMKKLAGIL